MNQRVDYLGPVAARDVETRSTFIWRCYAHVVGGILAFAAVSAYLYDAGISEQLAAKLLGRAWLLTLGAFMLVSWGASHVAHTVRSTAAQYGAYAVLIVAQALITAPLLVIANARAPGVIESAAGVTVLGCAGLIAVAMLTRKDFSFLRGMLVWVGMLALVAIVGSIVFGFLPRHLVFRRDDRLCGRGRALRHLQHHAPLPRRPLRGCSDGLVRLHRADVLVHPAAVHEPRLSDRDNAGPLAGGVRGTRSAFLRQERSGILRPSTRRQKSSRCPQRLNSLAARRSGSLP